MALWRFRYYVEADGRSDVRSEYERGSKELQGRFLSRLRILSQLPLEEWHEVYHKSLSGPCAGLAEIRFKADRVQQRPLGFHSADYEFTILFWAREKNGRWVPLSACEKALRRKTEIFHYRSRADALWLALE